MPRKQMLKVIILEFFLARSLIGQENVLISTMSARIQEKTCLYNVEAMKDRLSLFINKF